nr:unnamed protein product [Callosobruchus analis]
MNRFVHQEGIRKSARKCKHKKALVAVRHGMPKRRAAAEFGIPRQTLQFRLSQNFSKTDPGPTPILTSEEESLLVKWIFECQRKGLPRRKEDIQLSVKQFLEKNPRGAKNIYEVDVGQAKASITVLFTFAAAGNITPPMIVYAYKRLPSNIVNSIPDPSWGVAHSDLGWMKSEIFYEYMANVLHPHLKKAGVKFPVILFLDGHKSHLDRNLSDLCTKLEIILISLYPNTTRVLQPADVSAFRPLKQGWVPTISKSSFFEHYETGLEYCSMTVLISVIKCYVVFAKYSPHFIVFELRNIIFGPSNLDNWKNRRHLRALLDIETARETGGSGQPLNDAAAPGPETSLTKNIGEPVP